MNIPKNNTFFWILRHTACCLFTIPHRKYELNAFKMIVFCFYSQLTVTNSNRIEVIFWWHCRIPLGKQLPVVLPVTKTYPTSPSPTQTHTRCHIKPFLNTAPTTQRFASAQLQTSSTVCLFLRWNTGFPLAFQVETKISPSSPTNNSPFTKKKKIDWFHMKFHITHYNITFQIMTFQSHEPWMIPA